MRAMAHDDDDLPGTGLAKRGSAAAELEPRIDRKRELGDKLADHALDRVLGDDKLRLGMGAAARRRAETLFSLETMVAATFDHYRRLGLPIDPVAESHSPSNR